MNHLDFETLGDSREFRELVVDRRSEIGVGHVEWDATKISTIGITGMGSYGDAELLREFERLLHGDCVSRVSSAGDVGGGDLAHQFSVRSICKSFGGFGKIGVEIDAEQIRSHASWVPLVSGKR